MRTVAAWSTGTPRIRRAIPSDAEGLALVGAATFLESYAGALPGPDIVRHCAVHHAALVYERWLSDPEVATWVVEIGEVAATIGYAVMTPPDLPGSQAGDLELKRIYLLSRYQGSGTGRALVETVAGEARNRNAQRLMLGVFGENLPAMAFYERVGFARIGTREFQVGDKLCADFVLARSL